MLQHFSDFFVLRIAGLVRLFLFKGFTLKPEGIIDYPHTVAGGTMKKLLFTLMLLCLSSNALAQNKGAL